jgi:hypothetical protein
MFLVWMANKGCAPKVEEYSEMGSAIDRAKSEALYGNWDLVHVVTADEAEDTMVAFHAKEMRDAARHQREARHVQECAGVLPGV